MGIEAKNITIREILTDGIRYVVPLFQRGFSWDEEQVSDFLEDIYNVYKENKKEYFLGSMVFTRAEAENKVKILDGQQRMATILLFLAALRDVLEGSNFEGFRERAQEINKFLYITDVVTLEKSFKLELNREDKEFFEKLIMRASPPLPTYTSHRLLKKTYEFFKRKIKEYVDNEGEKFVKGILDVILNKLTVIKISVDSDADAHLIFETLNDRGLELSVADLVKNYLFSLAGKQLEVVSEKWKEIVDEVGDHNVSKFLRHFWISKYELVRKEDLYSRLKKCVKNDNIIEFVKNLNNEALIYSNLCSPSHEFWEDAEVENLLEELNIIRSEQAYVLLLAACQTFYRKEREKEKEKFRRILEKLVNFTFRWSMCNLNPNEMERLYSDLAIKLRKNEIDVDEILKELRSRTPKDEEFVESLKYKEIKNSKLAKYILIKVNNYQLKASGRKELKVRVEDVNLEHIIPRNPDRRWLEYFDKSGVKEWKSLINRIGNMTILLKEYNRKIANKFFSEKKKMYEKSSLPLNEELKSYEEFGPKEVEERSSKIADIARLIWRV